MTTELQERERPRDVQDYVERHVWGEIEYVKDAGSVLRVRGTGSEDEEMPVINSGYGFSLPKNSNAEVLTFSMGSDTNQKFALPTIPHDKQRQWAEGTGGVQHPTDQSRFVEFNGDETWLKDGNFKLGNNKELEVSISNGVVTMKTSSLTINGDLVVNGNVFTHNGVDVGSTHKHTDVESGSSLTGPPA